MPGQIFSAVDFLPALASTPEIRKELEVSMVNKAPDAEF
jgi:hypothetical protein